MLKDGRPFCDFCDNAMQMVRLSDDGDEVWKWEHAHAHVCHECFCTENSAAWSEDKPCTTMCENRPCEKGRDCWYTPPFMRNLPYETYYAWRIPQKPLFVPLKKKYFEMFESGEKTVEWRVQSPRWSWRNCCVGRAVVLSCGYSKKRRLAGVITGTWEISHCVQEDFVEVFGKGKTARAFRVRLTTEGDHAGSPLRSNECELTV